MARAIALRERWPAKIGQAVKWNFCLRAARMPRIRVLVDPDHRRRFLDAPEDSFADAGLTEEEKDLVRPRDWDGLIRTGCIFFMPEKLGAVVGVSNLHIYAALRGQTLEAFQATRNAPGALYSVAGKEGQADLQWDKR